MKIDVPISPKEDLKLTASIIVLAYKRTSFIMDAVKSVSSNGLIESKLEVIVAKSFIDTEIENALIGLNCKVIHFDSHIIGRRFLEAMKVATGEIIFLLDDDDIFLQNKIQCHLEFYEKYPEVNYIENGFIPIDVTGQQLTTSIRKRARSIRASENDVLILSGPYNPFDIVYANIGLGMGFNSSRVSFRRKAILPYIDYLANIEINLDTGLFFVAFYFLDKIIDDKRELTGYRIHSSNISSHSVNQRKPSETIDAVMKYASFTDSFYRQTIEYFDPLIKDPLFVSFCRSFEETTSLYLSIMRRSNRRSIAINLIAQIKSSLNCHRIRFFYRSILMSSLIAILGLLSTKFVEKITVLLGITPNLV